MSTKVTVVKKEGYSILANVHPKTKRLYGFSMTGVNVNPKIEYENVMMCENIIAKLLSKK